MTEPKAAKPPRSKGSKASAPPSKADAVPPPEPVPVPPEPEPASDLAPAAEPPRSEQDRLREVNEQLRIERELAGKRREQDLRRRR